MKWPSTGTVLAVVCAVLLMVSCSTNTPPSTAPAPQAPAAKQAPAAPPAQAAPSAAQAPEAPAAARPPAPPPLLGHLTRADLLAYESWKPLFAPQAPYVPDAAAVSAIRANAKGVTVLLIMGTWCPDSKREVPRYFVVMDAAGMPDSVLTMVGVDRSKKDPEGLTEKWAITRVPTFVFFRGGKEIGRFVEKLPAGSTSTLEAEIANALSDKK